MTVGIGKGFADECREVREAFRLGVITPEEYRNGLRQAGLHLMDDDDAFPPPPPLPPDLQRQDDGPLTADGFEEAVEPDEEDD